MRAVHLAIVVGAVLGTTFGGAGIARAGIISIVLSAGEDGTAATSSSGSFQFTNPTSQVAINELIGTGMAQAGTAGGVSFFNSGGVPVVLSLGVGSAYIASSSAPASALPSTGLAPSAPEAGGTIPTDAALLSLSLSDPSETGGPVLTLSATGADGSVLGSGQVSVPAGGWWVLGLTASDVSQPPPQEPPVIEPPVVIPPPQEPPVVTPDPPIAATPEPTTLALAAIGLPLAGAALRRRALRGRN
jgi:hypothetical protein